MARLAVSRSVPVAARFAGTSYHFYASLAASIGATIVVYYVAIILVRHLGLRL